MNSRSLKRYLVGGMVLFTLVAAVPNTGFAAAGLSAEGGSDSCGPQTPAGFDHAQRLRAAVGLPSDDHVVADSFARADDSCALAGIPLSSDEALQFQAVLDAQGELSNLLPSVTDDPSFAGAYFDGSSLTIASTDGNLGSNLQPKIGSLRLEAARFTHAALEKVAGEIVASATSQEAQWVPALTSVNVDERANVVSVGVPDDLKQATAFFAEKYGDQVSVVSAERQPDVLFCSVDDCGTKGGLKIVHDSPAEFCTSGFVSEAQEGSGVWKHYILTAGHCIVYAGVDDSHLWHNGNTSNPLTWGKGKVADNDFVDCSKPGQIQYCIHNDLGLIGMGGVTPSYWNRYYTQSGNYQSILGYTAYADQTVGQVVYRSGATTGFGSGIITAKPTVIVSDPCDDQGDVCLLYGMVTVDMAGDHGDSGAGFYRIATVNGESFRTAYGILHGGPTPNQSPTYYYPWDTPFYGGDFQQDPWTILPCATDDCPL